MIAIFCKRTRCPDTGLGLGCGDCYSASCHMPTPVTAKLPKPKSPDEFEDLVLDVLNAEWGAHLTRNGRSGQRQNGVDLFGKRRRDANALIGVQCKNVASLSEGEIRAEVSKAEGFQPGLAQYYFATTLDRDAELQEVVRLLSDESEANGKFPVEIIFWEDSLRALAGSPSLVAKYYGGAFTSLSAAGETKLAQLLYPPYEPPPATSACGAQSLATLLKPLHQEKIPFIGRTKERSELMGWADRPGPGPRVRLCIGPGGEGKTRLAAEFATELRTKGWLVGFVRLGAPAEELRDSLGAAVSDALFVVDYAGRRVDQVVALLNAAELRRSGRTALLLLERSQGEWWTELGDRLQGTRAALAAVTAAETLHLVPLPESDRVEMLGKASVAYGRGPSSALPRDDNALSVQIAALLGISGDRDELLKELLKRESSYWRQMARTHHVSGEPNELAAAVALATLVRPDKEQARRLLKLVFDERRKKIQVRKTLAWLSELYPGENSSIGSLAPDLVGEALIAEQLKARPRVLGTLLGRIDEAAAGNVFDALARTCLGHPQAQRSSPQRCGICPHSSGRRRSGAHRCSTRLSRIS